MDGLKRGQLVVSSVERYRLMAKAHSAVAKAVREKRIPPAHSMKCTDCGVNAKEYDHRNYYEPLEVEPVCRSCNLARGKAIPHADPSIEDENCGFRMQQANIRFSSEERAMLEAAAELNGMPFSTWIRHVVLKAAKRVVK